MISDSVMPPPATAAPSVLIASPIQAPATKGSCHRKVWARNGRIRTSTTAKTTTSDDTRIGTAGRARIAPPVAIEFARKLLFAGVRPNFTDLEAHLKGGR